MGSKLVTEVRTAFPGTEVLEVVIEEEVEDNGFGEMVNRPKCAISDCGCHELEVEVVKSGR